MVDIGEYGTDISCDWSFINGDLRIVDNDANLSQAIYNRLNTLYDSLDLFYTDYGSFLLNYLGWRRVSETLNFIKMEIERTINKDPRVSNFEVEVGFNEDGSVKINIVVYHNNNYDFSLNYILNENGVEVAD